MNISIRPLEERDLPAADRIFRLAFGTFLGLADPMTFAGDADYVATRWRAEPMGAIAAEANGELVGSNFASRWGSFGFFGPLTVRPDLWDQGVARQLLRRTMDIFAEWGTRHLGLFTFPQSSKHIALYQKFGFWARFLTPLMAKPVEAPRRRVEWSRLSAMSPGDRDVCLRACREITNAIYEGLDLEREIRAVELQKLGDTVIVRDRGGVAGLAVCHCGPGTEAGSGACFIKFGGVRPGPEAPVLFGQLLEACEDFAAGRGLVRLEAGVNMARHEAYRMMVERGFRTVLQGVAMQRPNEEAFHRPGVYVIDDWR
jgi:GNAT superfamily N-acetyltransferase